MKPLNTIAQLLLYISLVFLVACSQSRFDVWADLNIDSEISGLYESNLTPQQEDEIDSERTSPNLNTNSENNELYESYTGNVEVFETNKSQPDDVAKKAYKKTNRIEDSSDPRARNVIPQNIIEDSKLDKKCSDPDYLLSEDNVIKEFSPIKDYLPLEFRFDSKQIEGPMKGRPSAQDANSIPKTLKADEEFLYHSGYFISLKSFEISDCENRFVTLSGVEEIFYQTNLGNAETFGLDLFKSPKVNSTLETAETFSLDVSKSEKFLYTDTFMTFYKSTTSSLEIRVFGDWQFESQVLEVTVDLFNLETNKKVRTILPSTLYGPK